MKSSAQDIHVVEDSSELQKIIYEAPKPKKLPSEWASLILSRVFFPPIIIWDNFKWLSKKALGGTIGKLILLSQGKPAEEIKKLQVSVKEYEDKLAQLPPNTQLNDKTRMLIDGIETLNEKIKDLNALLNRMSEVEKKFKQYNKYNSYFQINKIDVITHDKAKLETVEIIPVSFPKEAEDQQYIINFVGNAEGYEDIVDDMLADANKLDCAVIGFNFRNVRNSEGEPKSANDLVTDGIAQVQRLLDKGIDPKNITLKGQSLGASIATLVTEYFHDRKQYINLFSGRSFSSVTNVVVGWLRTFTTEEDKRNGHVETFGKKVLGWVLKPIISFALALTQWEINAERALRKIDPKYREYMAVRSSKTDRKQKGGELRNDPVISHYASIYNAMTDERRKEKAKVILEIHRINVILETANPTEDEKSKLNKKREALEDLVNKIKSGRKMVLEDDKGDGHNAPLEYLQNRYDANIDGHKFFRNFVRARHTEYVKEKRLVEQGKKSFRR